MKVTLFMLCDFYNNVPYLFVCPKVIMNNKFIYAGENFHASKK